MNSTLKMLRPALVGFALLSAVTGLLYPAAVTGVARTLFPFQAEGSLVLRDGRVIGSELIGQSFSSPRYFWGRPSATAPMANNATGSSGSNQGPTNPALVDAVKARVEALKAADPDNRAPVPVALPPRPGTTDPITKHGSSPAPVSARAVNADVVVLPWVPEIDNVRRVAPMPARRS